MKNYDICIFDLDGTLINSLDDLADSCNEALKMNGMPVHETEKYRYFVGSGIKNLIKRVLPDHGDDETLAQRVYEGFNTAYQKNCLNKTKPYSGIKNMLAVLAKHGVKLAVLSNKPDDFSKMITDTLFDVGTFDAVWGKKAEFPIKPDPTALLAMLDSFSAVPDRCLYVGDSDVDCITARNAGVDFVGAQWGFRGRQELVNAGAEFIAATPEDIVNKVCSNE